jgi:MoaA/NifB/PqqE/SkfB family radical SAM enzyme
LTTAEGFRLLEEIRSFGEPLMVFTGGDPLKRPDLFDLLNESVRLGLRTTVTPSATPLLTPEAIDRIQKCGLARMAVSLDGPDAECHDGFRRVDGSFARTILALEHAQRIGLQTQVNTTVTRHNVGRLGEIAQWVERYGARLWSVFFLVPRAVRWHRRTLPRKNMRRYSLTSTICPKRFRSISRRPKPNTIGGTSRSGEKRKAAPASFARPRPR